MRYSIVGMACFISLGASGAWAQGAEEGSLQTEPYNKHHDRHFGHDREYPDRGAIFRDLPKGATVVNYAGLSYRFYNGVWFEPRGPAYIVVMPPIGLVVPSLPGFATSVQGGTQQYLYANDTFYLPRPELGGYEVVNDPADSATTAAKARAAGPQADDGGEAPIVTAAPVAAAVPAAVPGSVATGPVSSASVGAGTAAGASAATARMALTPGTPAAPATVPAAYPPAAPIVGPVPATASYTPPPSTSAMPPGAVVPAVATTSAALAANAATAGTAPATAPATAYAPTPTARYDYPTQAPTPTSNYAPTSGVAPQSSSLLAANGPRGVKVTAYPQRGQSADDQARDHYDCYRFGVAQSGYDPMRAGTGMVQGNPSDFERAQAACLESRGYALR